MNLGCIQVSIFRDEKLKEGYIDAKIYKESVIGKKKQG